MHSDHEMFIRGIERKAKVKVTFLNDERGSELVRQCGPLYYSRGRAEADGLDCYYLWDFEADEGYNFVALSPERIVSMELTEDTFSFEEISKRSCGAGTSTGMSDKVFGG